MSRFISFFFGPILNPDGNVTAYYDALGISTNATIPEIKKAFKQKSLEYHPDKLAQRGETIDSEKFRTIRTAYEVLSDPDKKKIYDRLGPLGLQLREDPTSVNFTDLANNFGKSKLSYRCRLYFVFAIIFGFFLLFPILLCLKLNGQINFSYVEVWIPLWILQFFTLWSSIDNVYDGIKFFHNQGTKRQDDLENPTADNESQSDDIKQLEQEMREYSMCDRIKGLVSDILIALIHIFFVLKMDHTIQWDWFYIFSPLFMFDFIQTIEGISVLCQKLPDIQALLAEVDPSDHEELKIDYVTQMLKREEAFSNILKSIVRSLFAVFVAFKLTGMETWSWWTVFIPIWCWLGLRCCPICSLCLHGLVSSSENNETTHQLSQAYSSACELLFYVFFAVMCAAWISTKSFSVFLIFIPIFILFCCVCCFFSTCILCPLSPNVEEPNDSQYNHTEDNSTSNLNTDNSQVFSNDANFVVFESSGYNPPKFEEVISPMYGTEDKNKETPKNMPQVETSTDFNNNLPQANLIDID